MRLKRSIPVVLAVAAAILLAVTAFLVFSHGGRSLPAGSGGLARDAGITADNEGERQLLGPMIPLVEQGDMVPAGMPEERTLEF